MDQHEFNQINIIPLVDVMLVLLAIVLTTSTFIVTGGIPINLPKASKAKVTERQKTQTIEIARSGEIHLNARPLTLEALPAALTPMDRTAPVVIRADRDLALQRFVDVLDTVKNLGFKAVSLQTEAKRK